jgi:dTDP-glucose 4,6-dehydratase
MGTLMLLEKARKYWSDNYENCRFHHISTDEVYGDLDNVGFFTETTPYNPSSPYSASKASSDMFVKAYRRTYGLNITISNCSNNYGPKQHAEKLIPTIIKKCLNNEKIPVYGSGTNIRDWLYVMDHCKAIDLIFHRGLSGETYNVGGRNEKQNIEVVKTICGILDKKIARKSGESYFALVEFVKDRAGHDKRYAIDAIKLESQLGWRAEENFESGITKTIEWYLQQLFTSFSE